MALTATSDAAAGAQFQSTAQAAGIDISRLGELAQLQLAVASIMTDTPPGSVAAGDIAPGTFGSNIPSTGEYKFPGILSLLGDTLNLSTAGAAFNVVGTTVASATDAASGAITLKANIGRGTGAVGGWVFQVPTVTSTGTTAQTLSNGFVLKGTTTAAMVQAYFSGADAAPAGIINATINTLAAVDRITVLAAAGTPALFLARLNGTLAAPTIILDTNAIGQILFGGALTSSTTNASASIVATATENWVASTAAGTKLGFLVTPNTTATRVVALTLDQDLSATFAGTVKCPVSTTARASFNLGNAGTAPTAPANGDMWIESNTIKARLNGATVTVTTS